MKSSRGMIWLCLFLFVALAGCGGSTTGTNSNTNAERKPDRVKIQVFTVDQNAASKTVTLNQAGQVQQFYQTINTLPAYPKDAACTMEMGPRYILTFSQGGKQIDMVTAERYGCKKLTLDKNDLRQGTQQFWQALDQVIARAS